MMKIFITLFTLMATALFCSAQNQVEFFQGTWEEAFAKAQEENKHVFVDAYTDWCYWCKVMDKETFTDPEIAAYLNAEFVPIKLNMEKDFGIDVAMKFRVNGFPTLLYFNPQGQLLKKNFGYNKDNSEVLERLKGVRADKRKQVFSFASQNFDLDYPEFIKDKFGVGGKKKFAKADTVDAWLETADLYSEVAWTALTQCPTGEKYETLVLENSEKYIALYGTQEFDYFLVNSVVSPKIRKAGEENDRELFDGAIDILNKYCTNEEEKAFMVSSFEMRFLKTIGDWQSYTMKADAILKSKPLEDQLDFANTVAWTLYEKCKDSKCLKMMESWMNKVIELEPNYMYLDTYAALLYKNGDLSNAKKYAEQAIEVGSKAESDTAETVNLLKKIEESMDDK